MVWDLFEFSAFSLTAHFTVSFERKLKICIKTGGWKPIYCPQLVNTLCGGLNELFLVPATSEIGPIKQ